MIAGSGGNDIAFGGDGNDLIDGDLGNDILGRRQRPGRFTIATAGSSPFAPPTRPLPAMTRSAAGQGTT